MTYQNINNLAGWILCAVATSIYALSVEPTASYWDCGEFIAVSYKLEVPHPPGAPFYLLVGRLFSMLALGDLSRIAYWVNMSSVLYSGLTVLFLFWSITALAKRLLRIKKTPQTFSSIFTIVGAGVLGSSAFIFSDSFWFSAVEAEVYAMSSLFTALIVWAMLKWSAVENTAQRHRWLLFISYVLGLSIGVHLLGLVTIPALALIYYYQHYKKPTRKGIFLSIGISLLIIGFIMVGVIQGLPSFASAFDIFFVNILGLPFNTGAIFFLMLLVGSLVYGLVHAHRKRKALLSTVLLSLVFIFIGYASYTLVLIRSNKNPTIDENNPEDVVKFVSYLKREQYGDRPLLYGRHFMAKIVDQKKGDPVYGKRGDRYEVIDWDIEHSYRDEDKMLFPRMYSTRDGHQNRYREHLGLSERQHPSFFHNLRFFFEYQIGHMYMRYLLWNFAGRESDIQGAGWLAPWNAFEALPDSLQENKGRNNYWMLPFLLGLLGLYFQFKKDAKGLSFVALLFLLTGVGVIVYLNMPPTEPRERDYIFTGSYYAFAIWIGLSWVALERFFSLLFKKRRVLVMGATTLFASITPVLMATENWDDHDRSHRYFSVDSARNLLESCAPHAILFTGGDNDTFPLWYAQEVEGIRTDVRVVVLSYFNTDWYIEQMSRQAYESAPLPFSIPRHLYRQGGPNDVLFVSPRKDIQGAINLKSYINIVGKDDPRLKVNTETGDYNQMPSRQVFLHVDTARVRHLNVLGDDLEVDVDIIPRLFFDIKGNFLEKKDLAVLDLIASERWERPIYFNHTSMVGIGMDVTKYLVQEGMAFRLLPVAAKKQVSTVPFRAHDYIVDTERMYENITKKFAWRGLQDPDIYLSEDYRNFVLNHRTMCNALARAFLEKGDRQRAKEILLLSLEKMPDKSIPYDYYNLQMVGYLLLLGEQAIAHEIAQTLCARSEQTIRYLRKKNPRDVEIHRELAMMRETSRQFRLSEYHKEAQHYAIRLDTILQEMGMAR